jgi:hypothetical protein
MIKDITIILFLVISAIPAIAPMFACTLDISDDMSDQEYSDWTA